MENFHYPGMRHWLFQYYYLIMIKNHLSLVTTSLNGVICKLMEIMVNHHLALFLEKNALISSDQSGFQQGWSPVDHLVALESDDQNVSYFLNGLWL